MSAKDRIAMLPKLLKIPLRDNLEKIKATMIYTYSRPQPWTGRRVQFGQWAVGRLIQIV